MRKEADIVLIRFRNKSLPIITPPLGIGYLLKALSLLPGVSCEFIDAHLEELSLDSTVQKIVEYNPKIIGFQTFTVDYPQLKKAAPVIKSLLPNSKIIAGGPHVTALPEQTLNEIPDIDFIIRSEGEEALPSLVNEIMNDSHQYSSIPNLSFRHNRSITNNKIKHVDVSQWKAPAWDMIHPDRYPPIQHGTFHKGKRVVPIITSRGCPYPCTFCAGSLMTGKLIRTRSIKDVVDEIEFLVNTYNFDEIIIEDENFTFYKDRVLDFVHEIQKRGIEVFFSFPNGVRLDKIDEEIARALKEINTYLVAFGIESGSKKTLSNMKKNWNLDEVNDKIRLLQKYNITVTGSFILGYCDETEEDINETINYAIDSDLTQVYFGNYLPLPGTENFNYLLSTGEINLETIEWEHYNSFMGKYPYHPKDVPAEKLANLLKMATKRFYFRPRIIFSFLQRASNIIYVKSMIKRLLLVLRGK